MRRVIPFVVVLALSACTKTPPTGKEASGQTSAAPAAEAPAPPKPVPAQLPDVLASVNGENITKTEFEQTIAGIEAQNGGPVPPDQRDRIFRGVLDQLIDTKLLAQEAKKRNIPVTDADVQTQLASLRQQFPTEEAFKQALQAQGLTLEKITADARRGLAISKLLDAEVGKTAGVKPEEIQAFYTQNPQYFEQKEQVHASHILIGVPQDADAATKAKAKAKAEQVLKDVKAGKDFAALAKQNSDDPGSGQQGGDLGFFEQGQMVGPFNDVAFRLKPGETSDLVETQFGYHIIKVAEKKPAQKRSIDEVRPQIQQYLENQNKEKQTEAYIGGLREKNKVQIFI